MTTHQRLHREPDPRVRRSLVAAFAVCALLVLGGLAVVGLRVQQVHLAYQLERLHHERADMQTALRQLEIEVATLQAPGRVEQRARQLGLVAPERTQIRLAREYAPAGTGLAAASRSRLAALPPDARAPIR
ncbi:MAG TPA: cell division protein FtsL [Methylomirabilota bacterium]|nr:cell division protein FtsL [Methylomirabilota bacterium]